MYLIVICIIYILVIYKKKYKNRKRFVIKKIIIIKDILNYIGYIKVIYCLIFRVEVFQSIINKKKYISNEDMIMVNY